MSSILNNCTRVTSGTIQPGDRLLGPLGDVYIVLPSDKFRSSVEEWLHVGGPESAIYRPFSAEQLQELELQELYIKYWAYVYKHLIKKPEDFDPKNYRCGTDIASFEEQLDDEARRIKVTEGY